MRFLKYVLIFLMIIFIVLVLFDTEIDSVRPASRLPEEQKEEILRLASRALDTDDVPVGSLVVYDGKIIGRGYNTVNRYNDLAGHAEINAMNDAAQTVGMAKFNLLDRSKLVVISTFEPCEMCRGAMVHYNIRKSVVMKDKSFWSWWGTGLRTFWYETGKKQTDDGHLQDSLFMLHPEYPGRDQ